jgi:hypothetical protein
VQKYNPNLDGSFVDLKGDEVIDWIHRTRRTNDFIIENKFKTVNIHKFQASFVKGILKPVLKAHVNAAQGTEPLEYVMEDIVKSGSAVIKAFETGDLKWFEIDDLKDMKVAEKIFAKPSLDDVRA